MAQRIDIVRGTTNVVEITVLDGDGNLRNLSSGEEILFGVKKLLSDENYVFVRAANQKALGTYTVELAKEDTEGLNCGRYFYDVGLQSGDDFFNILEVSPFIISLRVTKWGCAD